MTANNAVLRKLMERYPYVERSVTMVATPQNAPYLFGPNPPTI